MKKEEHEKYVRNTILPQYFEYLWYSGTQQTEQCSIF